MARRPCRFPTGVLTGTVKSYNAKGFGFILSPDCDHDVYFSRESLQQGLRTANIAGTPVHFELVRGHGPGGKPLARNLRPVHGVPPGFFDACHTRGGGIGFAAARARGLPLPSASSPQGIDYNGQMAFGSGALQVPRRSWSPHAGSRAIAGVKKEEAKKGSGSSSGSSSASSSKERKQSKSRSPRRKDKKKSKRKQGSDSSAEDGKSSNKGRKRRRSSSSSSSSSNSKHNAGEAANAGGQPEERSDIKEAKTEALAKLLALQKIHPHEARMKEWRALLRAWHPDKNPDNTEVATAVFQFLQKGKSLVDPK